VIEGQVHDKCPSSLVKVHFRILSDQTRSDPCFRIQKAQTNDHTVGGKGPSNCAAAFGEAAQSGSIGAPFERQVRMTASRWPTRSATSLFICGGNEAGVTAAQSMHTQRVESQLVQHVTQALLACTRRSEKGRPGCPLNTEDIYWPRKYLAFSKMEAAGLVRFPA
jgi:hypothetical protein